MGAALPPTALSLPGRMMLRGVSLFTSGNAADFPSGSPNKTNPNYFVTNDVIGFPYLCYVSLLKL